MERGGSLRRRRGSSHPQPHQEGDGGSKSAQTPHSPPTDTAKQDSGRLIEEERTETGKVGLLEGGGGDGGMGKWAG